MFKKIHSNCPAAGINDPVLTYTGIFIVVKFTNVIIGGVPGETISMIKSGAPLQRFRQVFWTHKTVSELQPEKNKLYVFMQKIRNSIREKMFLSIIFESYGTYEQKIY